MATRSVSYRLPWPPSMNTYWRRGNNVTYLTKKAREFRSEVCEEISETVYLGLLPLSGRLAVHLELTLPDKRKRDIDNHIKGCLDALMHAGVFVDDEQIDELRVTRLHVEPPGACDVTVTELSGTTTTLNRLISLEEFIAELRRGSDRGSQRGT